MLAVYVATFRHESGFQRKLAGTYYSQADAREAAKLRVGDNETLVSVRKFSKPA